MQIRKPLAKCLDLESIRLDESDEDEESKKKRDFGTVFGDYHTNYYCRLAKNWPDCLHWMKDQHCLEPNPDVLLNDRNTRLKEMIVNDFEQDKPLKSYDWKRMSRAYRY